MVLILPSSAKRWSESPTTSFFPLSAQRCARTSRNRYIGGLELVG